LVSPVSVLASPSVCFGVSSYICFGVSSNISSTVLSTLSSLHFHFVLIITYVYAANV
jgi:hypothetical protein